MKTQVDKLKKEQSICNKVVFFYLLIFGIIAITTSSTNCSTSASANAYNNFTEKKENAVINYMVSLKAELSSDFQYNLEVIKLDKHMQLKSQFVYQQMLYTLSNVEEPELLIEDILLQLNTQEATFNASQPKYFIDKQNAYLNDLYKQKNLRVWNEIEQSHQFEKLLMVENENNLDVETWMMDGSFWQLTAEENKEVEQSLAVIYTKKNNEVLESIEREATLREWAVTETEAPLLVEAWMIERSENKVAQVVSENDYLTAIADDKMVEVDEMIVLLEKARCCGIIEKEEPLAVESWMISEHCWCPNKKQTQSRYTESFALLGDN